MIIISFIRRVLATGYKLINFIKYLKEYREPRARISNIKSRNKAREPCSHKLEKMRRKEERLYFPKPIKRGFNNMISEIYSRTSIKLQR